MSEAAEPERPVFDASRLADLVRRGDPEALKQAYAYVFGNALGRLVLADHLAKCGFGDLLGNDNLKYVAGMLDGALTLAADAGFDKASLAVAALVGDLPEERTFDEEPAEFRFIPGSDEELD
ncbi:hypothetical protein [Phenylobacterium sp.]|uniref:hypothetical protein n=1 Tax=Phenylobacterium sp. TaxID=1871053 RepID=UPI002DE51BB6|nr:hypothetical protein [Phenylobacterium sp.]